MLSPESRDGGVPSPGDSEADNPRSLTVIIMMIVIMIALMIMIMMIIMMMIMIILPIVDNDMILVLIVYSSTSIGHITAKSKNEALKVGLLV